VKATAGRGWFHPAPTGTGSSAASTGLPAKPSGRSRAARRADPVGDPLGVGTGVEQGKRQIGPFGILAGVEFQPHDDAERPPGIASTRGSAALGALYAAPSVGAFLATLTSGWTGRVKRHGRAIAVAAGGWGLAIIGFGLAPWLWLALVALALAGAADMVSGIFRLSMWNRTIPDHLRGRLASIELISYTSGPLLGNAEAGAAASLLGLRASVVSGGILCVLAVAATSAALPAFWSYDARAPVEG